MTQHSPEQQFVKQWRDFAPMSSQSISSTEGHEICPWLSSEHDSLRVTTEKLTTVMTFCLPCNQCDNSQEEAPWWKEFKQAEEEGGSDESENVRQTTIVTALYCSVSMINHSGPSAWLSDDDESAAGNDADDSVQERVETVGTETCCLANLKESLAK